MALAAVSALVLAACSSSGGSQQKGGEAKLVVWTDATRKPGFEAYQKAHPDVHLDIQEVGTVADTLAKLQLANRAGKGWPDVLWPGTPEVAKALATKPYDFSADISKYVPADVIHNFAPGSMDSCMSGQQVFCLRNDIAPSVLWYNKQLMAQNGYKVPTTWQEFEQLGLQVAKDHPDYSVGTAGDQWSDLVYFWPSQCPVVSVHDKTLSSGLDSPNCTRVATMLDQLIAAGSMSATKSTDPAYAKKYGVPGKVLMMYGPIWYGLNIFKNLYGAANGQYAIAPPLKWDGEDQAWNGNVGGGSYVVSRHSHYLQAATDLALWMATGPYQSDAATVTFPAYQPAEAGWIDRNTKAGWLAAKQSVAAVVNQAIKTEWPGYALVYLPGVGYANSVSPAIGRGETITQTLPKWRKDILQGARAAGWNVAN